METEGKKILVDYLTDVADTFRSITGETGLIDARTYSTEIEKVAGGSGSKNSYQRNSVEEMNAITDAKDGDTCLCYHINSFNITEDATVSTITFPEEVAFENAITEYYNAEIRAEDSNVDLWGMIDLSPNNFMFRVDKMNDRSRAEVSYSSEDGITYKLDRFRIEGNFELIGERTIDFKMNITIQNTNEYIGAFLSSDNSIFYGLFKYNGGWKTLGLNYPLDNYNVEALQKYYNNGEQEGMLGKTDTQQGILKLNNFIKKYGMGFTYPEVMFEYFKEYDGERIPLLELNPNTSNVTDMRNMFHSCPSLKIIPMLDTSNVINMSGMFANCSSLETIPMLDTSNVKDMSWMFTDCLSLKTIPMLDASNVTDVNNIIGGCPSLTNLGGFKNLGKSFPTTGWIPTLYLRSPLLTHESLMNVINNLYDIKSIGIKTVTIDIGEANLAKLTAEEIAIATNKGWNVI